MEKISFTYERCNTEDNLLDTAKYCQCQLFTSVKAIKNDSDLYSAKSKDYRKY